MLRPSSKELVEEDVETDELDVPQKANILLNMRKAAENGEFTLIDYSLIPFKKKKSLTLLTYLDQPNLFFADPGLEDAKDLWTHPDWRDGV